MEQGWQEGLEAPIHNKEIMRAKSYKTNGQTVYFTNNVKNVIVVDAQERERITAAWPTMQKWVPTSDAEIEILRKWVPTWNAESEILQMDPFGAAHKLLAEGFPLVVNFENPFAPGGEYLKGAKGQEEDLCRKSTLICVRDTDQARKHYYDENAGNPMGSDLMLLSPAVCVFRDSDRRLLREPYQVAVMTMAAPDPVGAAHHIRPDHMDWTIVSRIEDILCAAGYYGYGELVVGTWDC